MPVTPVDSGRPVALVRVPLCGVPRIGVTRVGEVANTREPDPVSSLITPASSEELVAARTESLSVVTTSVLLLGIVVPFTLVAVAAPMSGVVNDGEVANTSKPEPVSSEITPANSAEVVAASAESLSVVTTSVLLLGIVVPLTLVAVATPMSGVVRLGDVAKTSAPEPVSSDTADARFALDGVARNVATPVPNPEMPVETGKPVALVSVPDVGVPSAPPLTTNAPEDPVLTASAVATPVPRPEIPVETGNPVALVNVPEDGVPRAPPFTTTAPEDPVFTARAVATPVPSPDTPVETGSPVALVSVPEDGVPNAPPLTTKAPEEPVLTASAVATPVPKPEIPVPTGRPVQLVRVPELGVPRAPPDCRKEEA